MVRFRSPHPGSERTSDMNRKRIRARLPWVNSAGGTSDAQAGPAPKSACRREDEASRDELGVLAELQASLRRIATLVARGVPPSEVFSAGGGAVSRRLGGHRSLLFRY